MAHKPYLTYNKDVDWLTSLTDFGTVMISVLPYTYFKKFIYQEEQSSLIYLRMYEMIQFLLEKQRLIEEGRRNSMGKFVKSGLSHSEIVKDTQKLTEQIITLFKNNREYFDEKRPNSQLLQ